MIRWLHDHGPLVGAQSGLERKTNCIESGSTNPIGLHALFYQGHQPVNIEFLLVTQHFGIPT